MGILLYKLFFHNNYTSLCRPEKEETIREGDVDQMKVGRVKFLIIVMIIVVSTKIVLMSTVGLNIENTEIRFFLSERIMIRNLVILL